MKIILHGYLKKLYPHEIEVAANTAAEAISFLKQLDPFNPNKVRKHYQVSLPDFQSRDSIYSQTDKEELHIHPVIAGAGGGGNGLLQIVIGIVMIVAAVWTAGTSLTWSNLMLGGMVQAGNIALMGAMMVLGGILQMLMPTPEVQSDKKSDYLGSPENTAKIGTPISMLFGRRKAGGQYLSYDIDAADMETIKSTSSTQTGLITILSKWEITQ